RCTSRSTATVTTRGIPSGRTTSQSPGMPSVLTCVTVPLRTSEAPTALRSELMLTLLTSGLAAALYCPAWCAIGGAQVADSVDSLPAFLHRSRPYKEGHGDEAMRCYDEAVRLDP